MSANDRISVNTVSATAGALSVSGLSLSTLALAPPRRCPPSTPRSSAISAARATLGAAGNRFNTVSNTIRTAVREPRGRQQPYPDVDVAEETSALARAQILVQAGVSVLAQANQMPSVALKLLG